MKSHSPKEITQKQKRVLIEAEILRQTCNKLTVEQRYKARQKALKIIYGK